MHKTSIEEEEELEESSLSLELLKSDIFQEPCLKNIVKKKVYKKEEKNIHLDKEDYQRKQRI